MTKEHANKYCLDFNTLEFPRKLGLWTEDKFVVAIGEACVDLELVFGDQVGSVIVRNTPILIVDGQSNEILIGDDVLKVLGIDVYSQLTKKIGTDIHFETAELESFPFLGGDSAEEIKSILDTKVTAITDEEERGKWRELLYEHLDEFRLTLGHDPPVRVEPMRVKWDKSRMGTIRPNRTKYTADQVKFLDFYTKKLAEYGMIYENPNAKGASESMVLNKVPLPTNYEEDYRMVVNLVKPNGITTPMFWPMPSFEDIQSSLAGAKYFLTLDLKSGYWQFPLHPDSQELFSFSTHDKVFTPTRVPQGATDSVMYFTQAINNIFRDKIRKGVLPWLDDLLVYADTLEELYERLKWVLEQAKKYGLKLSPKKLKLLSERIKWCGKSISAEGVTVDGDRIEALSSMPYPQYADDLMKFINGSNWFRTQLPEYARGVSELQTWLNAQLGDRRTKRRAKKVILQWNDQLRTSFERMKELIRHSVMQAHPDINAEFWLFTDASDCHWGAVLVQVRKIDPSKGILEQEMEPLYFLSGSFKGAQLRWSTAEKEGFAIVESVERLRHLLLRPKGFRLFTDHNNLRFTFGIYSSKKLNVRARLDRWSLKLQGYRYTVEHIAGEDNIWADMLSRFLNSNWSYETRKRAAVRAVREDRRSTKRQKRRHVAYPLVRPLVNFEWPQRDYFMDIQAGVEVPTGLHFEKGSDGLWRYKGRLWIPEDAEDAKVLVLTLAHYSLGGHFGAEGMLISLRTRVFWKQMVADVKDFVADCILCRCAKAATPTRVHLGEQVQPTGPNASLHFDFISIGKGRNGENYILVLRDGFSRFTILYTCESATAANAVDGILHWISLFGIPERFFSDNGPHFRCKVMEQLAKRLGIPHDFSTVYCAWANGLVERVMQDLTVLLKILLHEVRLEHRDWILLVPNIMYALNQRPSSVLDGLSPVQVHCGLQTSSPLDFVVHYDANQFKDLNWTPDMEVYLELLNKRLDEVHKQVFDSTNKRNSRARKQLPMLPEFEIGDYVLYSLVDRPHQEGKLFFEWLGPFQVVGIKHEYVYQIKDLVSKKVWDAHVTRLSFYSTKQMHVTGDLLQLIAVNGINYEIQEILDIIWDADKQQHVVKIHWLGFTELEASFEPFKEIFEQVPVLILNFLENFAEREPDRYQTLVTKEQRLIEQMRMKCKHFIK